MMLLLKLLTAEFLAKKSTQIPITILNNNILSINLILRKFNNNNNNNIVSNLSWWGEGLRASMTLRAMPVGTLCSWQGLPSQTGRKREARLRETNWSSKNGGFTDGLVTLPRKTKYS